MSDMWADRWTERFRLLQKLTVFESIVTTQKLILVKHYSSNRLNQFSYKKKNLLSKTLEKARVIL